MDFGCAAYCPYADQCLGDLPPEVMAQRQDLLKDRVAGGLKRYLKADFKRIGRASRAVRYAEAVGKREGANLAVVLPAACLHVLTVEPGEGSEAIGEILARAGASPDLADEVAGLLTRIENGGSDASLNEKILMDAMTLSDLEERLKENAAGVDGDAVLEKLDTETGRENAMKLLGK